MKSRRNFLKLAAAGFSAGAVAKATAQSNTPAPMKNFSVPTLKFDGPIRMGFIGVGKRARWHVKYPLKIGGVEIKAFADPRPENLVEKIKYCTKAGKPAPDTYTKGIDDYKRMIKRDDIDIVIISTPWEFHAQQAIDCMNAGKHVFIEVPAAVTVQECWDMVATSEKTGMHCMMLENCCYGPAEMRILEAVNQGMYGDITYGTGAYIHHLTDQLKEHDVSEGLWRPAHWQKRNGALYTTHGIGPVSQYMGINRGDQFDYVTSVSSPSSVRDTCAKKLPEGNPYRNMKFKCGDMNTSLIKTKEGRLINIEFDTATKRAYSRKLFLQGTKASGVKGPQHPLWKQIGKEAKGSSHGGMDYVMWWRILHCLKNGIQLDQDVYDAASWSALAPLSEESVAKGGAPVKFPDFTRGAWKKRSPLVIKS